MASFTSESSIGVSSKLGAIQAALAAGSLAAHAQLGLLEKANDLVFSESALLHIRHSSSVMGISLYCLSSMASRGIPSIEDPERKIVLLRPARQKVAILVTLDRQY